MTAKFYGIGVGPGEGELITKKAERMIRESDVLILPARDKEHCRAYMIAQKAMTDIDQKECVFIPFPMTMKEPELSRFHRQTAERVEEILRQDKKVAFLTIGDACIYSTFVYIESLVRADGFETEYVSGIPSFCAAAARLGIPLTIGNQELHVVPGSASVADAMKQNGTLIFMKSGKKLAELREYLIQEEKRIDVAIDVRAVSNCGYDNETIAIGAENISVEAGYLTVVIVRRDDDNENGNYDGSKETNNSIAPKQQTKEAENNAGTDYFENRNCKYYPCHEGDGHINCMFCYCPMYQMENCPGNPTYKEKDGKRIKSCINCDFPHKRQNYSKVMRVIAAK